MRQAVRHLRLARLLADTGLDSEGKHGLCRGSLSIRTTAVLLNRRNAGRRWPKTKYRRLIDRRFPKRLIGNRWQVEGVMSRHRRLLDSALRARRYAAQKRECLLRVLTHNLMILKPAA